MAHTGLFVAPVAGTPPVGMSPSDGRLVLGGIFGTTAQVVAGGVLTPSATAMTIAIAQTVWQLPDPTNSVATFFSPIDATTLTFAAAPATGGRIDAIAVKQNNVENGDTDSRVNVVVITGVASGSPVPPTMPSGYFRYTNELIVAGITNMAAATQTLFSTTTYAPHMIAATTLANLNLTTGLPGQHAIVYADGLNNGDYVWNVSAWVPIGRTVGAVLSYNATALSIPTGVATQLTDTYLATTKAVGVTVTGGAVTIITPGDYWVSGSVLFAANATGLRQIQINRNSTVSSTNLLVGASSPGAAASPTTVAPRRLVTLSAGDVLRFWIAQNSGGSLAVSNAVGDLPATFFEVVWNGV